MTETTINVVNTVFSAGTIGLQLTILVLIIGLLSKDKGPFFSFIAKNTLLLVFLVSLSGMIGSLVYEHIIGFAPCMLCWYQRIVMYPTSVITLVALIRRKSMEALDYALVLSIIGALISLWHNIEKLIGKEVISCGVNSPSCLQIFVHKFGYIDIPVMSLTFFVLIILLIVNKKRFH